MNPLPSHRLAIAGQIVAEAAELALWHFSRRAGLQLNSKRSQDFVSEADMAVERLIRDRLQQHFPADNVVGEELGGELGQAASWVIDPIDGTANFLRGSPLWGVSLGLLEGQKPVMGVVALPVLNELLAAETGQGVFSQGRPFARDSRFAEVKMVSLGDSADDRLTDAAAFYQGLRRAEWSVECYRCTTVGMVFAAKGLVDGHLQRRTTLWDIAGGLVICAEAGLEVTHAFRDGNIRYMSVAAGTASLMEAVRPLWPDLRPC
ncbi:inositol monophosphatase family protein [Sodalis sp. dw_96]|uniref:inositol monophosphatase family protein n=1 Tax=Sodalis sp. dw_96 TaxID=2719794 RepID=UPI001BD43377|nr:inositol monophosphatase family protein [Sodalis sp. dw_96]